MEIIQKQYHYRIPTIGGSTVQGICSRMDLELAKDEVRSLLVVMMDYHKVELWCNTTMQEVLVDGRL